MAPMSQRRVNMIYGKGYSKQVERSLQFHIVGVALAIAWEGKIFGLEYKDKLQPVSQWSWGYIILCCEKPSPRYRNLDKANVKKFKDQGHVQTIKLIRVEWRMVDCWRAVNTFFFSKARKRIVGRVKRSESPSVQVSQSSEEDLVVWNRNQRGLRGYQPVSLAPTGTMCLLCKCGTIVSKTYIQ